MRLRILLDSHALIWWFSGSPRLSVEARGAIEDEDNDVLVSAATAWEIATKHRLGRIPEAGTLVSDFAGIIAGQDFEELPITVDNGIRAGALSGLHGDPFDRMLISQAHRLDLVLISNEALFDQYGVRRLW